MSVYISGPHALDLLDAGGILIVLAVAATCLSIDRQGMIVDLLHTDS